VFRGLHYTRHDVYIYDTDFGIVPLIHKKNWEWDDEYSWDDFIATYEALAPNKVAYNVVVALTKGFENRFGTIRTQTKNEKVAKYWDEIEKLLILV
jgi:hypothetical protein